VAKRSERQREMAAGSWIRLERESVQRLRMGRE